MSLLRTDALTIFRTHKKICQDLYFELKAGETWAILGPNGCGKTTLLHTLAGLDPFSKGEIWLQQNRLKDLSINSIAQLIGVLFQNFNETFSQTVFDYCLAARFPHLSYFKRESNHDKQVVKHALEQMEVDALAHHSIQQLSGGEKRRVAIAALLAQTPNIFVLDEPTNHLDLRHQIKTLQLFKKIAEEKSSASIMALHDVNLAQRFCDHALLMFPHGEILQGLCKNILNQENLARLYQHPLKKVIQADLALWWPE